MFADIVSLTCLIIMKICPYHDSTVLLWNVQSYVMILSIIVKIYYEQLSWKYI